MKVKAISHSNNTIKCEFFFLKLFSFPYCMHHFVAYLSLFLPRFHLPMKNLARLSINQSINQLIFVCQARQQLSDILGYPV